MYDRPADGDAEGAGDEARDARRGKVRIEWRELVNAWLAVLRPADPEGGEVESHVRLITRLVLIWVTLVVLGVIVTTIVVFAAATVEVITADSVHAVGEEESLSRATEIAENLPCALPAVGVVTAGGVAWRALGRRFRPPRRIRRAVRSGRRSV